MHDHLGIAELVHHDQSDSMKNRFSNFRAKKDLKFPEVHSEFVGDLLHVNTDHLSDDQKVILKKIAERVARFGGSEIFSEEIANTSQEHNSTANATDTTNATININNSSTSTPMMSKSDQSDDDQGDLETDNNEEEEVEDDMMARSNLKKNSQKIMSAVTKQRITIKPDNSDTNGKYNEEESSSSNTTNETIITDPSRIYNKINAFNNQNMYNINSSSLISNYTEVMLGNISTSSIVDSLSLTNIPKDIYAGRRPPLMPSENDKLKVKNRNKQIKIF